MSAATHMDRQTFLANLRQSGLLTPEQWSAAMKVIPDTPRGRLVARALVEHGFLTKFQAELLLGGRTNGFFLGQYRILDQLGKGGMGRVFKAQHQTMNRIVALKVLSSNLVNTPKAQQLFQREVKAAARLVHPNIVTAYDANQIDNRFFLVMEYVDGPNLYELVRSQGPLPVDLACDFIRQAAQGLQAAHALGMVHRDIKPANLLVQQVGTNPSAPSYIVKILDFGLARLHSPTPENAAPHETILVADNTVMGTPDYLSPEQARNLHNVDIRSDLYSLGCTFYFLLTGQVPFPGGTTMDKLLRHSTETPTPVEQLRPEVPPAVAAIVRRLMAKDPADRFQTPAELIAALAAVRGVSASGAPASGVLPTAVVASPAPSDATGAAGAAPVAAVVSAPMAILLDVPEPEDAAPSFPTDFPGIDDSPPAPRALPIDLTPTPSPSGKIPALSLRHADMRHQLGQFKVALVWAVGIVLALIALGWVLLNK
ncbi:MAG: protein kinase [Gemmataceae bacterium]|nr:protein kinase [Gemmataceae bacterium]